MGSNIAKRGRPLRLAARSYGGAGLFTAFAILSTPTTSDSASYWMTLPLFAVGGVCIGMATGPRTVRWLLGLLGAVLAIILILILPTPRHAPGDTLAILTMLGVAVPGTLILVLARRNGWLWYWLVGIAGVGVAALTLRPGVQLPGAAVVAVGVAVAYGVGYLLRSSIPPALRQVDDIGRAHRAERQASELEAQRRQGARLLHDTVLATLTLLAHSGRGVAEDSLREQARQDAHLLRQLRLGEPLLALPEPSQQTDPVEETTLGTTLGTVKRRFDQLGLDVNWHGTNKILLPPGVLDGFLFAITESLENVRRHSGVRRADVTITMDDHAIRAMITDAGKGFDVENVDSERLGLKESVIARMTELGGNARLFSSPGAGTTVLLEVPR